MLRSNLTYVRGNRAWSKLKGFDTTGSAITRDICRCLPLPRSYLGVSVLRNKPAIIMKYYERGSLAAEIHQMYPHGIPERQALRWLTRHEPGPARVWSPLPAWACVTALHHHGRAAISCSLSCVLAC